MCKTIKHKVRFKASPETIYDLLADSRKRTEVTGRTAVMSDEVGGKFSTDAGQVTGVNVDLGSRARTSPGAGMASKRFSRGHLLDGGDYPRSDPRRRHRARAYASRRAKTPAR